jgi:hypothetical protein
MNKTMIDDLPYLEDLESGGKETFNESRPLVNTEKHIRSHNHNMAEQSGMGSNGSIESYGDVSNGSTFRSRPGQRLQNQDMYDYNSSAPFRQQPMMQNSEYPSEIYENFDPITLPPQIDNFNCRDIANHILNCPVCSKLYKDNKILYYIIIAILILIVAILLQKLLSSNRSSYR